MPLTSPRSKASVKLATISRSRADPGSGARSGSPEGRCSAIAARARFSQPFTESTVVSRMPAVSAALKPITSRSTSAARWPGVRCCSAVTKASETDSLASYAASGPGAVSGMSPSRASG
jgi:hypothetical protein